MKKFFTMISAFVSIALLGSSCQENSNFETPADGSAISFTSQITTRATDIQFEDGDQISVTATTPDGANNQENVGYSYANGIFSSETPICYDKSNTEYSFTAIYPYVEVPSNGVFSFQIATAQNEADNYTMSDLMSGSAASTSETTPVLTFKHILSKVVFKVTSSDVDLESVNVAVNTPQNVDCDIINNTFVASGDRVSATAMFDGDSSFKAIIAPQTALSGDSFAVITAGSSSLNIKFSNDKIFESGSEYNCDIVIANGVISLASDVTEQEPEIESITIASNTYKSLLVDIKVREGFTGTYAIVPVTASFLESYNGDLLAYAQSFITADISLYGTDYTVADNKYVFEGDVENFNIFDAWTPNVGSWYYVLAFGASADGVVNTQIACTEAILVADVADEGGVSFPDVDFGSIDVKSIESNSFVYDIKPADSEMTYLAFISPKSDYESAGSSSDRFTADITYLDSYLSYYYSTSVADGGLSILLNSGDLLDRTALGLSSESEYVIYAYGVDAQTIQPLTTIKAVEVTTSAYQASEGELASVTVSSTAMTNATVSVDAGDYDGIYYIYALLDSQITSYYDGDPEKALLQMLYVETLISTDLSTANGVKTFQGDVENFSLSTAWTIAPNSNYTVVVAGITPDGAVASNVITTTFTSATLSEDFKIDLTLSNLTETGATITSTLSEEGISYMTEFLESSACEGMSDDDISAYFENLYGGWISYALYTKSGDQDLSGYFKPGRNYTIFSYSYYANVGRLSEVFKIEFTTPGTYVADSEAPAKLGSAPSFESSRLNAPWLNYSDTAIREVELTKIKSESKSTATQVTTTMPQIISAQATPLQNNTTPSTKKITKIAM